jgi:hypothetical protein
LVERGHDLKEVTEVIADLRRRHKKASRLGNKNLQNWKELEGEAGKPGSLNDPESSNITR